MFNFFKKKKGYHVMNILKGDCTLTFTIPVNSKNAKEDFEFCLNEAFKNRETFIKEFEERCQM